MKMTTEKPKSIISL